MNRPLGISRAWSVRETGAGGDQEQRSGSWMLLVFVLSRFLEIWTFDDIWAMGKCEHLVGTGEEVIFSRLAALGWIQSEEA